MDSIQEKCVIRIINKCTIRFSINVDYVDEVEFEVVQLDRCEVIFSSPYLQDNLVTNLMRNVT